MNGHHVREFDACNNNDNKKSVCSGWMRFNCSLCGISDADFLHENVAVVRADAKKVGRKHADWPASSQRVRVTHSRRLIIGPIRDYCTQIIIMISALKSLCFSFRFVIFATHLRFDFKICRDFFVIRFKTKWLPLFAVNFISLVEIPLKIPHGILAINDGLKLSPYKFERALFGLFEAKLKWMGRIFVLLSASSDSMINAGQSKVKPWRHTAKEEEKKESAIFFLVQTVVVVENAFWGSTNLNAKRFDLCPSLWTLASSWDVYLLKLFVGSVLHGIGSKNRSVQLLKFYKHQQLGVWTEGAFYTRAVLKVLYSKSAWAGYSRRYYELCIH